MGELMDRQMSLALVSSGDGNFSHDKQANALGMTFGRETDAKEFAVYNTKNTRHRRILQVCSIA